QQLHLRLEHDNPQLWRRHFEQSPLAGWPQRLELGLVDDDILLGGIGIAGDDGTSFDLAVHGAVFFIADALAAAGVQLVEMDLLATATPLSLANARAGIRYD